MRISDGSSDVCSSDLAVEPVTVGDRDRRKPPLARSLCNGFGVDRPFEHRVAGKDAKRNEGAVGHRGTLGGRGDSGKGQLSPLLFIRPVNILTGFERRISKVRPHVTCAKKGWSCSIAITAETKSNLGILMAGRHRYIFMVVGALDRKSTRLNSSH